MAKNGPALGRKGAKLRREDSNGIDARQIGTLSKPAGELRPSGSAAFSAFRLPVDQQSRASAWPFLTRHGIAFTGSTALARGVGIHAGSSATVTRSRASGSFGAVGPNGFPSSHTVASASAAIGL